MDSFLRGKQTSTWKSVVLAFKMYPSQVAHSQQVPAQHLPAPQNVQKETSAQSAPPGVYSPDNSSRYGYNSYSGVPHASPPQQLSGMIPPNSAFSSASSVQPPPSSPSSSSPCHPFQNYAPPPSLPYAPVASPSTAAFHLQQPCHDRQRSAPQARAQDVHHTASTGPAPLLMDAGCPPVVSTGSLPSFSPDHPKHSFVQRRPSPFQQVNSSTTAQHGATPQLRGGDCVGQGQPRISPLHSSHAAGGALYDENPQAPTAHHPPAPARVPAASAGKCQEANPSTPLLRTHTTHPTWVLRQFDLVLFVTVFHSAKVAGPCAACSRAGNPGHVDCCLVFFLVTNIPTFQISVCGCAVRTHLSCCAGVRAQEVTRVPGELPGEPSAQLRQFRAESTLGTEVSRETDGTTCFTSECVLFFPSFSVGLGGTQRPGASSVLVDDCV